MLSSRRAFRDCVGQFATGVTVVTAAAGDTQAGMTVNSFTSVSLDPLLVLVSLAHGSRTLEIARNGGSFAISVLHRGQTDIALDFARPGVEFPFHRIDDHRGTLLVRGALATICCQLDRSISAGDHDLLLGEVYDFSRDAGEPLIFHNGRLGGLSSDSGTPFNYSIGGWEPSDAPLPDLADLARTG